MSLNILSFIEFLNPSFFGGSGKVLLETNKILAEKGHSVHTICRTTADKSSFCKSNNIFYDTYSDIDGSQLKKIKYYRNEVRKLFLKKTSEIEFDLILIHSSISCLGLKPLLKSLNIPIIYYFHSPWHKEYEIIASRKCFGIQCPIVSMLSYTRKRHEKKYLNLASGVVNLSQSMQNIMLEVHPSVKDKKLLINPGAANDKIYFPAKDLQEKGALRETLGLNKDDFLVITSRRLVPRTGVDVLIKAFAELKKALGLRHEGIGEGDKEHRTSNIGPAGIGDGAEKHPTLNELKSPNHQSTKALNLKLILTGGGESAEELKKLSSDLGIQADVIFTGHVSEEDLAKYYRCSDLFVMPTKFLEGFGLSTVEAMASGLPVVGTDIGGTPEILKKVSDELVIQECSVDAIAGKIREFVEKDNLNSWRDKSLNCFKENYTWEKHTETLLDFASSNFLNH